MDIAEMIPLILMSSLAFWKENGILFLLTAGIAIFTGIGFYDSYTNNVGLAIGLALIAYSIVCFAYAFRLLLWRHD